MKGGDMKTAFVCLLIHITAAGALSQETSDFPDRSPGLELLLESASDSDVDKSTTLDELEFYRSNPININAASFQEIAEVPFLSSTSAMRIIRLRDSLGFLSLSDMLTLPVGPSLALVSQFITFGREGTKGKSSAELPGSSRVLFRSRGGSDLQLRKSFRDGNYNGSRFRQYHRLEIISGETSGGILFDRDAGETTNDGFISGYVGLEYAGILRKLVVGNYTLDAGEGLTLSRFRSSSKGGDAVYQVKATGRSIVPHLSTDEFHYFQGAAATVDFYPLGLTLFFSRKATDATIDTGNTVTSFYTSGLFRSQTELKKKDAVNETVAGGIANIRLGSTERIGVSVVRARYDKDIEMRPADGIRGKDIFALGVGANCVFDSFTIFGEVAGNSWEARSFVAGFICQVSRRLSLASHVRSYSGKYDNPFAYGFGEQNGIVSGERGRYVGLEYRPSSRTKISSYYDEFDLPSSVNFTSTGSEYVLRFEQTLTKSLRAFVQYREKSKLQENFLTGEKQESKKIFETRDQRSVRVSMTFAINKWTELCQRIEFTGVQYSVSQNHDQGSLISVELNWSYPSPHLYGTSRLVFFDTKSYDSRLYEYEGDVRGGYSMPPLYGRGIRWYFVCGCRVLRQLELSLKYSETLIPDAATIGSGDSEIIGPLDNRVTFQVDVVL
jgi:hypothetical protein